MAERIEGVIANSTSLQMMEEVSSILAEEAQQRSSPKPKAAPKKGPLHPWKTIVVTNPCPKEGPPPEEIYSITRGNHTCA